LYRQHFNLDKKPFQISSDNRFLWLGEKHATALDRIKRGVIGNHGLLTLTGDIGTGKTTLINEVIQILDSDTLCVRIVDPCFEMYDLFLLIAQTLGFEGRYQEEKEFSSNFFSFLKKTCDTGKKVLIIVDEAQRTPVEFLNEIVSWSKFDLQRSLSVILAGQLEFLDFLKKNLGPAWKTRIDTRAALEPLDEKETQTYIQKRLEMAGADHQIFSTSAASEIYHYSAGIPRQINIVCDQSLIAGFVKGVKIIDSTIVIQEIRQLNFPVKTSGTVDGNDNDSHGNGLVSKRPIEFPNNKFIWLTPPKPKRFSR